MFEATLNLGEIEEEDVDDEATPKSVRSSDDTLLRGAARVSPTAAMCCIPTECSLPGDHSSDGLENRNLVENNTRHE